eukprot:CCRYP_014751-RA/>CCRYP_014751-RA protein AED:0.42 eAED:0.42 QI:0/-1/0/1/-1/1/1/0/178
MPHVTRSMTNQPNLTSTTPVAIPATPHSQNQTPQTPNTQLSGLSSCSQHPITHCSQSQTPCRASNKHLRSRDSQTHSHLIQAHEAGRQRSPPALAVMDQDTGTPHYRLLRHPAHTTTAGPNPLPTNLAAINGAGGRIKGTNTIRHPKRDIPKTGSKTSRTVNSYAPYDLKRKNPIAHA